MTRTVKAPSSTPAFWLFGVSVAVVACAAMLLHQRWQHVPDVIPIHYDLHGNADRWGGKESLWAHFVAPSVLTVLLFVVAMAMPRLALPRLVQPYQLILAMLAIASNILLTLAPVSRALDAESQFAGVVGITIACVTASVSAILLWSRRRV